MGGRTEWLVVVEFEIPVEKGMENLFRVGITDAALQLNKVLEPYIADPDPCSAVSRQRYPFPRLTE